MELGALWRPDQVKVKLPKRTNLVQPGDKKRKGQRGNYVDHYFTFDGLQPGLEYQFRIGGASSVGLGEFGPASFSALTTPTRPCQPDPPAVIPESLTMRSLEVEFGVPHDNGSAVVYFHLRKCHDGSVVRINRNTVRVLVEGLHPGRIYQFQVQAVNGEGVSNWSARSTPVRTPTEKPCTPRRPRVAAQTTTTITLMAEVPFDGGAKITGFLVQRRAISKFHTQSWGNDLLVPAPERMKPGMPPWLNAGATARSLSMKIEQASAAVAAAEPEIIAEAEAEGAEGAGAGSEVQARPAQPDGQAKAREGEGRKREDRGFEVTLVVVELMADMTYDFRVAAVNENGRSEWSGASMRTKTSAPLVPGTVGAPELQAVYADAVMIGWDEPALNGAAICAYMIEWERVAGPLQPLPAGRQDKGKNGTVETGPHPNKRVELQEDCQYRLRVAARNAAGWNTYGPWSETATCSIDAGF